MHIQDIVCNLLQLEKTEVVVKVNLSHADDGDPSIRFVNAVGTLRKGDPVGTWFVFPADAKAKMLARFSVEDVYSVDGNSITLHL